MRIVGLCGQNIIETVLDLTPITAQTLPIRGFDTCSGLGDRKIVRPAKLPRSSLQPGFTWSIEPKQSC